MTTLAPMRPDAFGAFLEKAVAEYADDNVASGRWHPAGALERSRADFKRLLPAGLATPGHYLFEIRPEADKPVIGHLWFSIEERNGAGAAFVYNVGIDPPWRRQGHATRAFRELEDVAIKLGATSIGLHVFDFNHGARAFYAKLGYTVASVNMTKRLDAGR